MLNVVEAGEITPQTEAETKSDFPVSRFAKVFMPLRTTE
jgi:hypothetical protein